MATIEFKITFTTPLHIGAGEPGDGPTAFARDMRGHPSIRAATLKGLHRASTRDLALALGLGVCTGPMATHMCQPLAGQTACAVCSIFGSPWVPGVIFYRDLTTNVSTVIRTETLAPQSRHRRVKIGLYSRQREVLPAPLTLSGQIDHRITHPALLALALVGLRSITAFGAGSATGHGLCTVEARAFDVLKRPVDEAELGDALRQFQKVNGQP